MSWAERHPHLTIVPDGIVTVAAGVATFQVLHHDAAAARAVGVVAMVSFMLIALCGLAILTLATCCRAGGSASTYRDALLVHALEWAATALGAYGATPLLIGAGLWLPAAGSLALLLTATALARRATTRLDHDHPCWADR